MKRLSILLVFAITFLSFNLYAQEDSSSYQDMSQHLRDVEERQDLLEQQQEQTDRRVDFERTEIARIKENVHTDLFAHTSVALIGSGTIFLATNYDPHPEYGGFRPDPLLLPAAIPLSFSTLGSVLSSLGSSVDSTPLRIYGYTITATGLVLGTAMAIREM